MRCGAVTPGTGCLARFTAGRRCATACGGTAARVKGPHHERRRPMGSAMRAASPAFIAMYTVERAISRRTASSAARRSAERGNACRTHGRGEVEIDITGAQLAVADAKPGARKHPVQLAEGAWPAVAGEHGDGGGVDARPGIDRRQHGMHHGCEITPQRARWRCPDVSPRNPDAASSSRRCSAARCAAGSSWTASSSTVTLPAAPAASASRRLLPAAGCATAAGRICLCVLGRRPRPVRHGRHGRNLRRWRPGVQGRRPEPLLPHPPRGTYHLAGLAGSDAELLPAGPRYLLAAVVSQLYWSHEGFWGVCVSHFPETGTTVARTLSLAVFGDVTLGDVTLYPSTLVARLIEAPTR